MTAARNSWSPVHWLGILLVVVLWLAGSAMDIEKYAAHLALPLLVVGVLAILALCFAIRAAARRRLGQPPAYVLAIVWALIAGLYAGIHPIAARHTVTQGNDSEDALYRGASGLLHLHFPYYAKTYLHNPITPMPGALLLDAPFTLLGDAGLQNVFWFGVLAFFALRYFRLRSTALLFLLLILANAHTFVNLMTGADYPVNCFYVAVASFWFLHSTRRPGTWAYWLSALLLGLTLSSRLTYLLIIPILLAAALVQELGLPRALARFSQPLLVTALVTAPFYLYDRSHFSPLHVANFLSAMTPAHQHVIFILLTGSAVLIALAGFAIRLSQPRFYLLAALATAVILLPPGLIVSFRQHFSVTGVLVLGYTDTAYILLCLWLCRFFELAPFADPDRPGGPTMEKTKLP